MQEENLLEIKGLSAGYGGIPVIEGIDLSVKAGEILAIVGESGSGKSTLFKAIAQLPGLPADLLDGSIYFDGKDLRSLTAAERQKFRGEQIAMVFQHAGASLVSSRKIRSQVEETVRAHRQATSKEIDQLVREVFESVGLSDVDRILSSYPFELSGGMAQRVAIALAVILRPRLILADEPTSALDATIQVQVIDELLSLKEKLGTAMLVITHHIGVARRISDRIAVMQKGRIVEQGETEEVLANPQHPYTKSLLQAVPKLLDGRQKGAEECCVHQIDWHGDADCDNSGRSEGKGAAFDGGR